MNVEVRRPTIAIVGGGFSGAAVAYHLARLGGPIKVIIYEPRALLGAGLAYGASDPNHRTNVPAAKMSLIPGDEGHFLRWINETGAISDDPDVIGGDGFAYPRRSVFGRYMNEQVRPFVESGAVEHVREPVTAIEKQGNRWTVRSTNTSAHADFVIIATTHPEPRIPSPLLSALEGDPRLIADATLPDALASVQNNDRLLIVGSGLTMADIVATLDAQGHYGKITAISRRGLRSKTHAKSPQEPFGDFSDPLPKSASELLRRTRETIRRAAAQGIPWQAVIDAVRAQAQRFWPALPVAEQRRIVRHLRPYWDVHRFRIAPQPEAIIQKRVNAGVLQFVAASIESLEASTSELEVVLRISKSHRRLARTVDRIILATGPNHGGILSTQPFLKSLSQDGFIHADSLGLGIACDAQGRTIDAQGRPDQSLWIAGPLARAAVGELMGLPQISEFAARVANNVFEAAREYA
ncbi:FAD/NAD(P)-binding protein [Hyphomicrobium sp. 99]|uniref:FAD/NAD(P)-binding protein n=1 Tax=Hyphomicrobium sp. 99 TaxID=1163419 RepID=UPI0005F78AB0|nr:FAD/NAD(P)-binding protein [Hyphomicrobium sp. 99]